MSAGLIVRTATVGLTALVLAALGAPVASAHSLNGPPVPEAAHYLTVITSVTPALAGLTATVDPHGDWIQISNTSAQTVTVLGYGREPYLRIDAQGVEQNVYSPSVYLNQAMFTDLSQSTQENLPPQWQSLSTGRSARWHDHRIHWMGAGRAPNVSAHPGVRQVVGSWTVHVLLGSTPVLVNGTLSWLPLTTRKGLSTTAKIVLAVDCAVFVVGVAMIGWMRRRPRPESAEAVTALVQPGPLAAGRR